MDVSLSSGGDERKKARIRKRMVAAFENRTNLYVEDETRLMFDYALYLIEKERAGATAPPPRAPARPPRPDSTSRGM